MNESATIEVAVESKFAPRESDPGARRYVFAYTVTIAHRGGEPVRLLNRHWVITNANGERQEVRGRGVVGEQPRLEAGQSFKYTSAAIIETPVGAMQGDYEFESDGGARFLVPIQVFSLSVPNVVH
jgi:ApaG protein